MRLGCGENEIGMGEREQKMAWNEVGWGVDRVR